jgi:hypothetical protein
MATDPRLDGDPRVSRLRRNMVAQDDVAMNTSVEAFLQALLETNARNQMAFEFLVAHHLSVGRPDKVVACLPRLQDFSYRQVPRHFQEAAAIHAASTGRQPAVPGCTLEPAVLARADAFARIMAGARSRDEAAQSAQAAGFGGSYFYYLAFSTSRL